MSCKLLFGNYVKALEQGDQVWVMLGGPGTCRLGVSARLRGTWLRQRGCGVDDVCVQTARKEMPVTLDDDALVCIRRQWNGKKVGSVPFDQFHNPYWDDVSGEMGQRAPRPFIHGHVWCTDAQDQIAHLFAHEKGARWIKVCVVRRDNKRETFERLLEIVGPRLKWKMGEHWP